MLVINEMDVVRIAVMLVVGLQKPHQRNFIIALMLDIDLGSMICTCDLVGAWDASYPVVLAGLSSHSSVQGVLESRPK